MALIVQTLPHVFWEYMPASLGLWILRGRASFGMKIPHHFPKWVFFLFLMHTASASPCPDDSISHLHSLPGTFPSGVLSYPSFCFNIFILKCIQYAIWLTKRLYANNVTYKASQPRPEAVSSNPNGQAPSHPPVTFLLEISSAWNSAHHSLLVHVSCAQMCVCTCVYVSTCVCIAVGCCKSTCNLRG